MSRSDDRPDGDPTRPLTPSEQSPHVQASGFAATAPGGSQGSLVELVRLDELVRGGARYELGRQIGEGGMGTVVLCSDRAIGRRVAMKLVRGTASGPAKLEDDARFLREARIQGQLEHPSIVPVYDVGRNDAGAAFFTMKRVGGVTLAEVIARLRAHDPEFVERFTLRRLLEAMGRVCLAIQFAHERGVLHRDLKPANVMLGEVGEVYVLDWGIARLLTDATDAAIGDDALRALD